MLSSIASSDYASSAMQMQQEHQNRFKNADTDGNGGLSIEEFQARAPANAPEGSPSIENIFAEIDVDEDGLLTEDEMQSHDAKKGKGGKRPPPPPAKMSEDNAMQMLQYQEEDSSSISDLLALLEEDDDDSTVSAYDSLLEAIENSGDEEEEVSAVSETVSFQQIQRLNQNMNITAEKSSVSLEL